MCHKPFVVQSQRLRNQARRAEQVCQYFLYPCCGDRLLEAKQNAVGHKNFIGPSFCREWLILCFKSSVIRSEQSWMRWKTRTWLRCGRERVRDFFL
jgi:hypothetical protein